MNSFYPNLSDPQLTSAKCSRGSSFFLGLRILKCSFNFSGKDYYNDPKKNTKGEMSSTETSSLGNK